MSLTRPTVAEAIDRGAPITFLPGKRETRTKAFLRSLVPPAAFQLRDYARGLLGRA